MRRNVFEEHNRKEKYYKDNIFAKFLQESGLYDEIEITRQNIYHLIDLVSGLVKINTYCPICGEMRVFNGEKICYYEEDCETGEYISRPLHDKLESLQNLPRFVDSKNGDNAQNWIWKNWQCDQATRLMVFSFQCTMETEHRLDYIVITTDKKMIKIGQFPSVADLSFFELKKYKKELSKEDMSELKRAIGLYAQGIGVGSYVYLRRIFERIIDKAKNMAIIDQKIEESEYIKAHVDERIKMLKDYLPDTMVKSTAFYE